MIQEASVTGVLKMILIILLVYYGVKIVTRLLAPVLFKHLIKKAEQRFGQNFGGFNQQQPQSKVGETVIDKVPKQQQSNKTVGEYVDYEEID